MYAFNTALRSAWRSVFEQLSLPVYSGNQVKVDSPVAVSFDTGKVSDATLIQTCGFPYMKSWRDEFSALCVTEFDIAGCEGIQYSSWFITSNSSGLGGIVDWKGKRVAVNGHNSNSGMNVLRHEISQLGVNGQYFSSVIVTGSHEQSMLAIVRDEVDCAAVDAVSFKYACDQHPELRQKLKIVGQSAFTTGLPFVTTLENPIDKHNLFDRINSLELPESARSVLSIRGFKPVSDSDFSSILELEYNAICNDYPTLV